MDIEKIVLVIRATRLQESVQRFSTKAQAKFFVKSRGQSFDDYEKEDSNYQYARDQVTHAIPSDIKLQVIDRSFLPNFVFGPKDIVMTLGQDGLVVNTAKYLNGQPIVAVNPDPERFDGILLPFQISTLPKAMHSLLKGSPRIRNITMGKVQLNDGQSLFAFNDFFVGARSHISARYTIKFRGREERHSSSGVIVSTPAGSTGWLSSVFNMAKGIANFRGDNSDLSPSRLEWDERRMIFVVREPFKSKWSGSDLVAGEISEQNNIILESHMPESGVIFSDGMESDFLEFNSGTTATIALAEKFTRLVVG
ncbi:MAG TPA: NAD+ kinase [Leptospiraceae bacterium]|nr:NAD+ kinase [Leptospiraceae bacterium]HMW07570.1 NAD+ kinase [Leptospiraceae bacterium]HMX33736.1 NAD+ kinase [Leptospiraceae bacterium]HMY33215.1 NAD+ kinase [Leptospiraceae bacterium]HMZ65085.1 NAD+ kinase [Leptospiraceae bacterium]